MSFPAHSYQPQTQQSVFPTQNDTAARSEQPATPQFATTLLPENSIVDLESLASEKKKTAASDGASEKRTLNDLQKARASSEQPTPVMPMHHAAGGAPMHNALVPTGAMMMQQPMMHANAMAPNATMQQQMMMMNPQAQAQWMQQQQQFAMANGMMHANGAYAAPASGAFAFQQQQQ